MCAPARVAVTAPWMAGIPSLIPLALAVDGVESASDGEDAGITNK